MMELERLEKIKDLLELKNVDNFEPNHDKKVMQDKNMLEQKLL